MRNIILIIILMSVGWVVSQKTDFGIQRKPTLDELKTIAASVQDGDVVIYTMTGCPYCAQAMSWMRQYGFTFAECNVSVSSRCEREYNQNGATGVPYLVVKGHHMKNGFDGYEFLAALKNS